jgi:aspartate kinase
MEVKGIMIVMKFGGTSVGDFERIKNVASIIKSNLNENPVIVVSALGGVTDNLISIANLSLTEDEVKAIFNKIIEKHHTTIEKLNIDEKIIQEDINRLNELVNKIITVKKTTSQDMDLLMSFGERMSSKILASYLSAIGIKALPYNAYDIGMITNSNFGNADILPYTYQKLKKNLSSVINKGVVPVITGFIGKSKDGSITTLGRGGSDYTASIIGAAMGASEIQIWTDVDGILTADPKIVKTAKSIDVVSYEEASELALSGAKVLHPKTILPAIEKNIPVRILNTFNPSHKGTLVLNRTAEKSRVVSITYKKHIVVISLSNRSMLKNELLKAASGVLSSNGIFEYSISASESSVSITIDEKEHTPALISDLKKIGNVESSINGVKVSIVGNDISFIPKISDLISSSLKGIKIEIMPSSESNINHSIVVTERQANSAVKRLHTAFFS